MVNFVAIRFGMVYEVCTREGHSPLWLPEKLLENLRKSLDMKEDQFKPYMKFFRWMILTQRQHNIKIHKERTTDLYLSSCTKHQIIFPKMRIIRSHINLEDIILKGSAEFNDVDKKNVVLASYKLSLTNFEVKNITTTMAQKFISKFPENLMQHDFLGEDKSKKKEATGSTSGISIK
ncbi:TPA_asm: M [Anthurium amnicola virus 1]|uniref:M n=2 Tax=root TaxID=1 RepID=A0A8D9PGY8_9RHAB|nr:M [Anthurium amnicola virus 1] [Anthurium amnicola virus 1]DAF42312.1 TPA_asm: M [Anthurium amnicola virus 1]